MFVGSSVLHLFAPRVYESIVPRWLPRRRAIVYASGLAELACAAGLATEASWAPVATAATLFGVWPANVQMAIDASRSDASLARRVMLWVRVPLQLPMLRAALHARS